MARGLHEEVRMTIKSIDIGQVVLNATVFNFKNVRTTIVNETALLAAVERLFMLLQQRQIATVLVGGIALLQYVEGRNTEDIDLIIAVSALQQLPEVAIHTQDEFFAQGKLDELKIDFLLTRNRLFQHVQQHHTTLQEFVGHTIQCATVEGLLLLKMYALPSLYRQGNFDRVALYEGDIMMLLHRHHDSNLEVLFAELANHLNPSDLASLREIVAEIQQRIRRFGRGFS